VTISSAPVRPATEAASAIEVTELIKRYPKRPVNAVDGISFAVTPGEIFGLLGPNGAGKTTTVGILTTRVKLTGGRAAVAGVDVAADPVGARRKLAVVPQRPNPDRSLTIKQNLLFHASYFGIPAAERDRRADLLLEELGLGDRADDKIDFFSGGQSQRLMIARALMHDPQVLFLDEPTTGLDPQARLFVWDRIRELRTRGVTILLTTQNMDEAEALADRVGIMDHGKILALDTPGALTASLPGSSTLEVAAAGAPDPDALVEALSTLDGVERAERVEAGPAGMPGPPGGRPGGPPPGGPPPGGPPPSADGELRVRLYLTGEPARLVSPVAELLARHQAALTDVHIAEPSLEDVFITLTGRGLR
jgi:ABC-2 type transport system ATP-binding protein